MSKGPKGKLAAGNDSETYAIIGAAMAVHSELGRGFLEQVYQQALEQEFLARGIPFLREVEIPINYRGRPLGVSYRADFLCYETVVVETKALAELQGVHDSQVINYLKATGLHRGLLLNFGSPALQYRRLVFELPETPHPKFQSSCSSADD